MSDIDYLFGHFCGILVASTLYFAIYCVVKKNRPKVYPKVILPGLISGVMWGIAMGELQPLTLLHSLTYCVLIQWDGSWPTKGSHWLSVSQSSLLSVVL